MTPQDQIIIHDPDNGKPGDCFRACLASILDMNIRAVPHFAAYPSGIWIEELIRWLKAHYYELNGTSDYTDERAEAEQGIDGYLIVAGKSPRGKDVRHAVVYYGKKMVHDPHPDKTGITEAEYYYRIERMGTELKRSIQEQQAEASEKRGNPNEQNFLKAQINYDQK